MILAKYMKNMFLTVVPDRNRRIMYVILNISVVENTLHPGIALRGTFGTALGCGLGLNDSPGGSAGPVNACTQIDGFILKKIMRGRK